MVDSIRLLSTEPGTAEVSGRLRRTEKHGVYVDNEGECFVTASGLAAASRMSEPTAREWIEENGGYDRGAGKKPRWLIHQRRLESVPPSLDQGTSDKSWALSVRETRLRDLSKQIDSYLTAVETQQRAMHGLIREALTELADSGVAPRGKGDDADGRS